MKDIGYTGAEYLKEEMDSRGMNSEIIWGPSAEDIQSNLRNGKVMLVSVNSNTKFTGASHIMTIVDINTEGQVYIINPSRSTEDGWFNVSDLMAGCDYIVVTEAGASGIADTSGSTNTTGYVAVVATWNQSNTTVTTDDPNVNPDDYNSTQYSMTSTTVNYRGMVDRYSMPFDFLWALLVVGEEKEFVFELADLVYNSDIQVTIYDNLTVTTTVDTWHYEQETKNQVDIDITGTHTSGVSARRTESNHEDILDPVAYNTTKTVVTYTNTINQVLTKANTWIVDYTNEYSYSGLDTTTSESTVTQDDQQFPSEPNSTSNTYSCEHTNEYKQEIINEIGAGVEANNANLPETPEGEADGEAISPSQTEFDSSQVVFSENYAVRIFNRYINISDTISNTTESKKFTEGTPTTIEKTKSETDENGKPKELNFVTIFKKSEHIENRKNIISAAEWLFEIVETNGKPDLDLVKYLLYKATGTDYGVTEYDFSEYDASKFKEISGFYGNSFDEKIWWALLDAGYSKFAAAGVLGNFKAESGVKSNCVQGDYLQSNPTQYDEDYTNKVNSGAISREEFVHNGPGGGGYGVAQWTTPAIRKSGLYDLAKSRGVGIDDEEVQIEFLLGEMEPSNGGADGYAATGFGLGSISPATARGIFMASGSPEDAADAFFKYFERAGDSSGSTRQGYAREYYERFKDIEKPSASGKNADIISTAKSKLGCPYVYGAAGPDTFDCSGFVQWVYGQNGISLPRTTYDYEKYIGTNHEISWSEAQPGDIVWRDGHMGMYWGNNQYIHAPHSNDYVKISSNAQSQFTRVFRFTK